MNKFRTYRIQLSTMLLLTGWLWVPASHAVELDDQTLRYSVTYITQHAGELEIIINREGGQFKTTAISHLSPLAMMFLNGLTAETFFTVDGDLLRLERGHLLEHESTEVATSFEIDRTGGNVKFVPGKEADPVKQDDVFESTTFPLVLVTSDIPGIEGQHIREISPKRVRTYVYLAPEKETLEMDGVNYDTWKVIRHKLGDPTRTVTIWLDRNDQQIPLRIITTKDKKDTEIKLISRS